MEELEEGDFLVIGDLEEVEAANKKAAGKKVKKGKKGKKKKDKVDVETKLVNAYGESPHLQAIENAYLLNLDAKHAKESHLKAVKKLQMLRALRHIQRFWRRKYSEIKKTN